MIFAVLREVATILDLRRVRDHKDLPAETKRTDLPRRGNPEGEARQVEVSSAVQNATPISHRVRSQVAAVRTDGPASGRVALVSGRAREATSEVFEVAIEVQGGVRAMVEVNPKGDVRIDPARI